MLAVIRRIFSAIRKCCGAERTASDGSVHAGICRNADCVHFALSLFLMESFIFLMLFWGKLDIDVEFLRNILHIGDHYIFQIQKFCCIILTEHRDFSFR